jgi:hypothetical protein
MKMKLTLSTALAGMVVVALSIGACGGPAKTPLVPDAVGDDAGVPDMPAPPTTTTPSGAPTDAPPPPPG